MHSLPENLIKVYLAYLLYKSQLVSLVPEETKTRLNECLQLGIVTHMTKWGGTEKRAAKHL